MMFTGVSQATPIRSTAVGHDFATTSSVMVPSDDHDLVESTVSQGMAIIGPTTGERSFLDNFSGSNQGDNAAGSTAPGSVSGVVMGWQFSGLDYWTEIGVSLEPAPQP